MVLMITISTFCLIWGYPFHAATIMLGYFLFLFIYLLIKQLLNRKFRESELSLALLPLLFILIVCEVILNFVL
jgi:hypothetical protein